MTARIVLHQTILVAVTILSGYRMKKKKKKKNAYWNLKQSQGTCIRKGYPIKNTRNFFGHDFKRPKDEDSSLKNGLLRAQPKGHVIYLCDVTFAN